MSREYAPPLSLAPCESAARFAWQDGALCAFVGGGVDFYVKPGECPSSSAAMLRPAPGREYGFCIAPAHPDSGMHDGDALVVHSDPAQRMTFLSEIAGDEDQLADGAVLKTGARKAAVPMQ